MRLSIRIVLGLACLAAAVTVQADGDATAGREKSFTCTGCHSSPGYRNAYPGYTVPKLGGQKADYLTVALKAYRDGDRKHETMHAQIVQMTDSDIDDIATYFSQLVKE
ncbi:MAG: c-type cytochrome [Acidiferrobacterales bacterium]|nr:c-type cytochrome [Acidiferrobacterales bacterium]